jgi:hypothetical protein
MSDASSEGALSCAELLAFASRFEFDIPGHPYGDVVVVERGHERYDDQHLWTVTDGQATAKRVWTGSEWTGWGSVYREDWMRWTLPEAIDIAREQATAIGEKVQAELAARAEARHNRIKE